MSYGGLVDEVLIHLTLVIDYITYAYNTLVSFILIKFLNQTPLHVHTTSQSYHPAVLVTGTSSGIGRDVALTLAKQGYTVFATVRREDDAEELKNTFAEFDNVMNGSLLPLIMDVTNKDDIQKAYNSVRSTIGREIPFVGLVNNAAFILYVPLEIASESCNEDSFNTNYFSIVNLTKKFLPLLRESRGRVVNIGSIASWGPAPSMGIYSATKAALRAITQVWRMETRSMGMHFSLIEPGVVATRFTENQLKAYRNFVSFTSNSKYHDITYNITSNAIESYENLFRMIAKRSSLFTASTPPAVVSDAIVHALTAPYPKNTYYVGLDARLIAVASWFFGDRIFEAVQAKALAVPNDMINVM
ncbi:17710_t:CDS:2 [Funneliformis geosporum]|uniref:3460_t:CDS:1 n=1 Tax=Funneliformis geosporum TaxID=1117311 RepID=A0A9W4SI76_9GLOM|nr:17710_t:CDS:2 [Funneliformis geosporum]CAI2170692.1 3460_t:CDS:2 [Funneliformis geosporum]